ncbi:nibrin [Aphidius gifuensis]|uniref:nibrin n=1 Tax=Aphidius gifuensis TaxID=684658 RepID=UPI001CDC1F34|nr:nibrin [Aphidius gifuensis]XP_044015307.1 nibrin [Aphidius gifuensis]XP_044015308.1 nibrin [Aphidius gifuensis]
MWCIKEKKNIDNFYNIKPGDKFKIGRKGTDIILENDGSISRMHAFIEVKKQDDNSTKTICLLTDVGSRYGTQIIGDNTIKLEANKPQELKHNDTIQFGLDQYFFQVEYLPFVVLTSGLSKDDKIQLMEILDKVGGTICNQWTSQCTHLTVSEAKMTQKLASCLAAGVPIVTIKFWQAVKTSEEQGKPLPNISDYCPELDDQLLRPDNVNLLPLSQRKNVFNNLLFIFFLKRQYNIYKEMITLAGGEAIWFNDREISKDELSNKNTILIQFDQSDSQNEDYKVPNFSTLEKFYKKLERRLIPETDIPIAILHCSVEKSCNPYYSYHDLLKRRNDDNLKLNASILAVDTQDVGGVKLSKNSRIVPESIELSTQEIEMNNKNKLNNVNDKSASGTSSVSKKRPIEEEHSKLAPIFKRSKIQTNDKTTEDSQKNVSQLKSKNLEENSNNEDSKLKESQKVFSIKRKENVIIPETLDEDKSMDDSNQSPIEESSSMEVNVSKKRKSQSVDDDDDINFTTPLKKSRDSSIFDKNKLKKIDENIEDCSKINTPQKKQSSILQSNSDEEPTVTKTYKEPTIIENNKSKSTPSCSKDNSNQNKKSIIPENDSNEETPLKTPRKNKDLSIVKNKKLKIDNKLSESSNNNKKSNMLNTDDEEEEEPFVNLQKEIKKSPVSVRDEDELPYGDYNNEISKDISRKIKNIKIKKEENDHSKMGTIWANISRVDSYNMKKRFMSNRSTVESTKPFIVWQAVPWKT